MFIISTALFAGFTVLLIPVALVLVYIIANNYKYGQVASVFGIESSTAVAILSLMAVAYMFLCGFCVGEIPVLISSSIFVFCLVGSVFLSVVIFGILKLYNKDRIRYGNVLLADQAVCDRIETAEKQIASLRKTMDMTSVDSASRQINKERLDDLTSRVSHMVKIHQYLQEQAIELNACLSEKDTRDVDFKNSKEVRAALHRQTDRFEALRNLDDDLGPVRDIMRKYRI